MELDLQEIAKSHSWHDAYSKLIDFILHRYDCAPLMPAVKRLQCTTGEKGVVDAGSPAIS